MLAFPQAEIQARSPAILAAFRLALPLMLRLVIMPARRPADELAFPQSHGPAPRLGARRAGRLARRDGEWADHEARNGCR